jgi:hypothetical protein
MNRAIELHDSIVQNIARKNGLTVIHFRCAYVHESAGDPGVDAGVGWFQEAVFRIKNSADSTDHVESPTCLVGGHLTVGTRRWNNVLPIQSNYFRQY